MQQLTLAVVSCGTWKTAVHNLGPHYPVEVSAPHSRCTALKWKDAIYDTPSVSLWDLTVTPSMLLTSCGFVTAFFFFCYVSATALPGLGWFHAENPYVP